MSFLSHFIQINIYIYITLYLITHTYGYKESVLLTGFSADPPSNPEARRVIIAYHTDGCKVPLTVGPEGYSYEGGGTHTHTPGDTYTHTNTDTHTHTEKDTRRPMGIHAVSLQSADARTVAMSELQNRVRRRIYENVGLKGAEFDGSINGDADGGIGIGADVKLKSRYLSSIQFEVTEVPDGLTENDMIELGSDLPCVQYVEKDGFKIADTVNPNQKRIIDLSGIGTYRDGYTHSNIFTHKDPHTHTHKDLYTLKDLDKEGSIHHKNSSLTHTHTHSDIDNENEKGKIDIGIGIDNEKEKRGLHSRPNDIYFDKQWSVQSSSVYGVNGESVWNEWKGSASMVVAVIDSGCDLNHADLQGQLWVNMGEENCDNGIDDDNNGYVDDCFGYDWVDNDNNPSPRGSGHGTGAAGIISAKGDNGVGITGLCWNCKLMCLRFISGVEGKISNQVAAIDYAVKNGARISNNSYGGYGFSSLEYEAIRRAETAGHLFVASAGNNNLDTDLDQNPHTPSVYALSNILCAGASTPDGKKAGFSNFGVRTVDVFAPGTNIQTIEEGGRYAMVSGTSFAAPIVTGAAALVWSRYPQLSNVLVRKCIIESCKRSDDLEYDSFCGGVVDIQKALQVAKHYASTLKDFDVDIEQENEEEEEQENSDLHIGDAYTHTHTHTQPHFNRIVGSHTSAHTNTHTHSSSALRGNPLDGILGNLGSLGSLGNFGKLFRSPTQVENNDVYMRTKKGGNKELKIDLLDGHLLDTTSLLERALPKQLLEGQSHTHTPSNTHTHTPSNTHTHTPSNTHTHTPSNTHTHTPSNTHTHTPSNTHTHTPHNSTRRLLLPAPKQMMQTVSLPTDINTHAWKTLEGVVNRLPLQENIHTYTHTHTGLKMRHKQNTDTDNEASNAVVNTIHTLEGVAQNIHIKQGPEDMRENLNSVVSGIQNIHIKQSNDDIRDNLNSVVSGIQRNKVYTPIDIRGGGILDSDVSVGTGVLNGNIHRPAKAQGKQIIETHIHSPPQWPEPTVKRIDDPTLM